jgi:hypothetical protein
LVIETGDEELKRISKGKETKIREGVMVHTDELPDSGFNQRTSFIDPDTGDVVDKSNYREYLLRQRKKIEKEEEDKKWKPIADFRARWGGIIAQQNRIHRYQTQLQQGLQELLEEEKKNPALKEHSKEFKRELRISVLE